MTQSAETSSDSDFELTRRRLALVANLLAEGMRDTELMRRLRLTYRLLECEMEIALTLRREYV